MKSWLLFSFLCLFSKAPCKVEQTQGSSGKMAWILEAKNRAFCPSLSNLVTHRRWAQWLLRAHWDHHCSVLWLQENIFSVEVSKHHMFLWCLHSLFSMRPAIYSLWKNLKFMKKRLSSHLPGHPILPSSWRSAACSVFPSSEVRSNLLLVNWTPQCPTFISVFPTRSRTCLPLQNAWFLLSWCFPSPPLQGPAPLSAVERLVWKGNK